MPVPSLVRVLEEWGCSVSVLVLVETRRRAGPPTRLAAGADPRPVDRRCQRGRCSPMPHPRTRWPATAVTDVYLIEPGSLDGYAAQAWAGAGRAGGRDGRDRRAGRGHRPGQQVLAPPRRDHRAADGGQLRLVTPDEGTGAPAGQHRWAGLLLEDAVDGGAGRAVHRGHRLGSGRFREALPAAISVHVHKPELAEADLVGAGGRVIAGGAGGASLATARVVVGGGRGVGGPDGFAPLEELAELLGGVVRGCPAWSPPRAGARTSSRSADRHQDHPGALPGLRHRRRDPAHRKLRQRQATSSRSTPTRAPPSWPAPTTPSSATFTRSSPPLVEALPRPARPIVPGDVKPVSVPAKANAAHSRAAASWRIRT